MNCKNCQNTLLDASDFCNVCGAKVIRNRLTFRNLFEHISETFFNYDNKLLRTFIVLFTKPEDPIGGYINGVRKKYVNPISYLGLSLTIGGLYIFIMTRYFPETIDMSGMTAENQKELYTKFYDFIQDNFTFFTVLFLPFYALISRLVFLKRKEFNFTEHIIFFMYIIAQYTLLTSVINIIAGFFKIPGDYIGYLGMLIQFVYVAYCLKRLYKLSVKGIILKTLLFLGILFVIMILFIIVGIIGAIFFKDTEFMKAFIEAQKAGQEASGN